MEESQVVKVLGALAQETRLRIVRYLVTCGETGAAAGQIGANLNVSASGLSFHLSNLENAKIITSQRVSRSIIYRADFDRLGMLVGYLLHDCCKSHPTVDGHCQAGKCSG